MPSLVLAPGGSDRCGVVAKVGLSVMMIGVSCPGNGDRVMINGGLVGEIAELTFGGGLRVIVVVHPGITVAGGGSFGLSTGSFGLTVGSVGKTESRTCVGLAIKDVSIGASGSRVCLGVAAGPYRLVVVGTRCNPCCRVTGGS